MRWVFGLVVVAVSLSGCGGGVCSGDNCACEGTASCEFECPQGGCNQACSGESSCTASCEGGGCNQSCTGAAECTFTCDDGCNQSCLGTTGACETSCVGDGCVTDDIM